MRNTEGFFLIASPYLSDSDFFRSVIYVVRHDDEGAFGVVVNQPGPMTIDEALGESLGHRPKRTDAIYLGGPVQGPLIALHTLTGMGEPCGTNAATPENADVWITTDEDHLRILADRTDVQTRWFAQYSGWGPAQLEAELDAGGWLVGRAAPDLLFGDAAILWERLVKRQGRAVLADLLPSEDEGFDPQRN
jgi:putative transcriptional regulator